MRFKLRDRHDGRWHHWFAWYPVFLTDTGEWCWLETVQRIAHEHSPGWGEPWVEWEHCETVIEFTGEPMAPEDLIESTSGITDLMRGGRSQ